MLSLAGGLCYSTGSMRVISRILLLLWVAGCLAMSAHAATYTLEDGSVVKVTVAEYLTPNGRAINGVGLEPDFFVEGDEAQLDKAIELARAALQKGA